MGNDETLRRKQIFINNNVWNIIKRQSKEIGIDRNIYLNSILKLVGGLQPSNPTEHTTMLNIQKNITEIKIIPIV